MMPAWLTPDKWRLKTVSMRVAGSGTAWSALFEVTKSFAPEGAFFLGAEWDGTVSDVQVRDGGETYMVGRATVAARALPALRVANPGQYQVTATLGVSGATATCTLLFAVPAPQVNSNCNQKEV